MKYIWLALTTLLAPIILLLAATWLLYQPGPPPAAQDLLASYLVLHNRVAGQPEYVQSLLRSPRPGAFTPAMSRITYGRSLYFGTTYDITGGLGDPTNRPAPYPARDIWCAVLTDSNGPPHTVLVAQHEDLYVAAWVLHEPTSESAAQSICR